MSRIYDNWERLVDATLKRAQFYELCHAHSRTPSTTSLSSDFTSPSPAPSIQPSPSLPFRSVSTDLVVQAHVPIISKTSHRYKFHFPFSLKALKLRNSPARPSSNSQPEKKTELPTTDQSRFALINTVVTEEYEPISDYNMIVDARTVGDLHEIAKRMAASGYVKECSHAYITCRRNFLEESFSILGVRKISNDEVQRMQWTVLEDEIDKWIEAMNVAFKRLFPSERWLCDRVFFGFSSAADLSFMEVCSGFVTRLLDFANAVVTGSRAPERLFKVLDVYETVRDLMPEFELNFSDDQYCVSLSLRSEAMNIWKRLVETVRRMFMELESLIRWDPAEAVVLGGGLHPMTRYVMNYLRDACQSRLTLERVFEESVDINYRKGDDNRSLSLSSSFLAVQMKWIMEVLVNNLEAKSKLYKDSALCSVFMMNNGRYMVQMVKDNEVGTLLGEDWILKHTAKVRQYHVNYQCSSWGKVLGVLRVNNNYGASNKLELFNSYFEELCKSQSSWVILDEQLRDELRVSISGTLSSAYRNFIGTFQNVPDIRKHVIYSAEDIVDHINELFEGTNRRIHTVRSDQKQVNK